MCWAHPHPEPVRPAALALNLTVGGNFLILRLFPLTQQKFPCHAAVDEIPREDLVVRPLPCRVKTDIQAALLETFKPQAVVEILAPGIKHTALFIGFPYRFSHTAVSSGKDALQDAHIRLVPVVFDALLV